MYANKTTPTCTHEPDVNAWFSEDHLKGLCPKTFNGRYQDSHAEDWLVCFEWYCKATMIPETGQNWILYTGLLMIDDASCWYEQLSEITNATIDSQQLSAYQVFKFKFCQCFINTNHTKDAFNQIKNLQQKRSVNEYVTLFMRYCSHLTDFTDKDAICFFCSGLKPELHQLVDNHPDIAKDDINGLIALTECLDKMNKNEHQYSHSYHKSNVSFHTHAKEEMFPQPMELDDVHAHPNTQSRFQWPMSKDEIWENDFSKNLCFYCHKPNHMINTCPKCNHNKKSSNSKVH